MLLWLWRVLKTGLKIRETAIPTLHSNPSFLKLKIPEMCWKAWDKLGLFGTLKLALALQFTVTNAYFSVACNTKVSIRATLK